MFFVIAQLPVLPFSNVLCWYKMFVLVKRIEVCTVPELPEVETVRRVLAPQLAGRKILGVDVCNVQVVAYPDVESFAQRLAGQVINGMRRRGKFLVIMLSSGDDVVLHLRMTGSLLLVPLDYTLEKHTHLVISLDCGDRLCFTDPRRFGRFWLVQSGAEDLVSGIHRLGLEPFDSFLTGDYLRSSFGKSRKAIKSCLLMQDVVAGIGNIYSDEILFKAGISPLRAACSLNDVEWRTLAAAIHERLAYYVGKNDISPADYLSGGGRDYRNTPYLNVYGHAGKPCPLCGEPLYRAVVGGRSSVFCRNCQR